MHYLMVCLPRALPPTIEPGRYVRLTLIRGDRSVPKPATYPTRRSDTPGTYTTTRTELALLCRSAAANPSAAR
jgi:hypothetical protein